MLGLKAGPTMSCTLQFPNVRILPGPCRDAWGLMRHFMGLRLQEKVPEKAGGAASHLNKGEAPSRSLQCFMVNCP